MKAFKTMAILLLSLALFLSGCSFLVPDEYKDGVKIDRAYPDDDLPVYENAIVFSCEEDEGEITLQMGTKDDLDDIIDFYQDFFDDEEITLTDEDEGKRDYHAEGHITDYDFTLNAEEPNDGDWQEKLFEYVIEIVVTPAEEPVQQVAAQPGQTILGSWAMTTVMLGGSDITTDSWEVLLCTYYEDGTGHEIYKWPYQPEYMERFTWQITGSELTVIYDDGTVFTTLIDTLTDSSFIELSIEPNENFDTIIYERVSNDAWRPAYTTSPYDESSSSSYYGDPANIDDIYGAWVDYYNESSFSLWPDGTGRLWNSDYENGWDITWEYYDDGWLYLYYSDGSYESYYISFDGEDIYVQSEELDVFQYMERPDYAMTYIPWVLIYDGSNPDYVYDYNTYLYFYSDNTYEVYEDSTVFESGTWELNPYGDLSFDNDSAYYYYISYEGNWLLLYNGTYYYWYQNQYYIQ